MVWKGDRHPGGLTEVNLAGADLRQANLEDVDLTGANLYCTNLTNSNLIGVNLTDAHSLGFSIGIPTYSPNTDFTLPSNLWLIGTMNTADRSIALMDSALRRRFFFSPFYPSEPPIEGLLRRWLCHNKPDMEWVADVVDSANEKLDDRDAAIGPSHFMDDKLDDEWTERIWKHSVLPYLAEQFFDEEDRLDEFTLDALKAGPPTEDVESDDEADPEAD